MNGNLVKRIQRLVHVARPDLIMDRTLRLGDIRMNDCFKCKNVIIDNKGYAKCKFNNEYTDVTCKIKCDKYLAEW